MFHDFIITFSPPLQNCLVVSLSLFLIWRMLIIIACGGGDDGGDGSLLSNAMTMNCNYDERVVE